MNSSTSIFQICKNLTVDPEGQPKGGYVYCIDMLRRKILVIMGGHLRVYEDWFKSLSQRNGNHSYFASKRNSICCEVVRGPIAKHVPKAQ